MIQVPHFTSLPGWASGCFKLTQVMFDLREPLTYFSQLVWLRSNIILFFFLQSGVVRFKTPKFVYSYHINQHWHLTIGLSSLLTQLKTDKWIKSILHRKAMKIRGGNWRKCLSTLCSDNLKQTIQSDKAECLHLVRSGVLAFIILLLLFPKGITSLLLAHSSICSSIYLSPPCCAVS